MKLKRTFINGQEVYVPLTEEEEKQYNEQNETSSEDSNENENSYETSYEEKTNNNGSKKKDYINVEKDMSNIFTTVAGKITKVANIVGDAVGDAFEKTGTFVKKSFDSEENAKRKYNNEKNRKLAKLLPYLSEEDIHELINKIIDNEESTKDLNLNVILPYLSSEDAGALLLRCIKDGKTNIRIESIVKYVDSRTLDKLVEMYINGELNDVDIEDILPYLDDKNIKKIFEHEILNK